MDKDFQWIQKMVDCLCGVQVHLVPNDREQMMHLAGALFQDVFPNADYAIFRSLRMVEPGCIYVLDSFLDLQYAVYCQEDRRRVLMLGPCRGGVHTEQEAAVYLRAQGLGEVRIHSLLAFCRQQPLMPFERLLPLAQLLAQRLRGSEEPIPCQRLDPYWHEQERNRLLDGDTPQELEQIRRVEIRYEASAALTEAVKQGNLSLAYRFIQKMNSIPEDLNRNPDTLRNSQNLCIVLNTQLRVAMEEAGVSPYRLDQLSGGIGRQIEKLKSVAAVNAYFGQILSQYCALAQEKEHKDLSPFARQAVTYIHSHLSDNLTVQEAAGALLVNPDYLSARFHQEVGQTFISYVNQRRVKQAASLLRRTGLQIQQIAAYVGYNNTSYFTRQFVKCYGVTPREYRSSGG